MEVHGKPQGSPSCLSPTRDSSGVPVSKELLTAGSDGRGGDGRVTEAWAAHVRRRRRGRCSPGAGGFLPGLRTLEGSPGGCCGIPACFARTRVGALGRAPGCGPGRVSPASGSYSAR